jgi:hypothetical protein
LEIYTPFLINGGYMKIFIVCCFSLFAFASQSIAQGWEVVTYSKALEEGRSACGYPVLTIPGDRNIRGLCLNCPGNHIVLGGRDGEHRAQNECLEAKLGFSQNKDTNKVCVFADYVGAVVSVGVLENGINALTNASRACCQKMGYPTDFNGCQKSSCWGEQGAICFSRQ